MTRKYPPKTNMTMETQPWMKMYLLLKMVILQCQSQVLWFFLILDGAVASVLIRVMTRHERNIPSTTGQKRLMRASLPCAVHGGTFPNGTWVFPGWTFDSAHWDWCIFGNHRRAKKKTLFWKKLGHCMTRNGCCWQHVWYEWGQQPELVHFGRLLSLSLYIYIYIWLVVKMLVPGLGPNTSFPLGPAS